MSERDYNDVKHDYRLAKVALSMRGLLKKVENTPFNFAFLLLGREDFDEDDGDSIDNTCGGIPKDIVMAMLRCGNEMLAARVAEREIILPITDDEARP